MAAVQHAWPHHCLMAHAHACGIPSTNMLSSKTITAKLVALAPLTLLDACLEVPHLCLQLLLLLLQGLVHLVLLPNLGTLQQQQHTPSMLQCFFIQATNFKSCSRQGRRYVLCRQQNRCSSTIQCRAIKP